MGLEDLSEDQEGLPLFIRIYQNLILSEMVERRYLFNPRYFPLLQIEFDENGVPYSTITGEIVEIKGYL